MARSGLIVVESGLKLSREVGKKKVAGRVLQLPGPADSFAATSNHILRLRSPTENPNQQVT